MEITFSCRCWEKEIDILDEGSRGAGRGGQGQRSHGANEGLAATVQEEPITPDSFSSSVAVACPSVCVYVSGVMVLSELCVMML